MLQEPEVLTLKLKVGSDPYRLVTKLQEMSDDEANEYIEKQVQNLALKEAGRVENMRLGPMRGMHEMRSRMRHINRAAKEREAKFRKIFNKYNIKVLKWSRISDSVVLAHYIKKERH